MEGGSPPKVGMATKKAPSKFPWIYGQDIKENTFMSRRAEASGMGGLKSACRPPNGVPIHLSGPDYRHRSPLLAMASHARLPSHRHDWG